MLVDSKSADNDRELWHWEFQECCPSSQTFGRLERTHEVQKNLDAVVEELRSAKEELKEAKESTAVFKRESLGARQAVVLAHGERKKLKKQVDNLKLSLLKSRNEAEALKK